MINQRCSPGHVLYLSGNNPEPGYSLVNAPEVGTLVGCQSNFCRGHVVRGIEQDQLISVDDGAGALFFWRYRPLIVLPPGVTKARHTVRTP